MILKNRINDHTVITDGAMGTYYAQITNNNQISCEKANVLNPCIIKKIHEEYINAGAELIRTNTFAANTQSLNTSIEEVEEIIRCGITIAKKAANPNTIIGASIGPISDFSDQGNVLEPSAIKKQYETIIDVFLEEGIINFIFETFGSLYYLKELSQYIKEKQPNAFVLTQFALTADGKTRKGISANTIVREVENTSTIDACGFNCGVGPAHLLHIIKKLPKATKPMAILPNAGYPAIVNERTVYTNNPEYFGQMMQEVKTLGIHIIGGCCGTTPEHIKYLVSGSKKQSIIEMERIDAIPKKSNKSKPKQRKIPIMVELSPPSDTNIQKTIEGAKLLKQAGATMVTIPDSPMAKMRANAMLMAAKIQREAKMTAMPHMCCRDQNIIALKGAILSGYIEQIRNILVVTGDPVAESNRGAVKNVFNLNSYQLTQLIRDMNNDLFNQDPINIACALNLNVKNPNLELSRMEKKIDYGASVFLTQPIFEEGAIETLATLKRRKNIRIIAGLMPVVTYRNAQFINNELPGIHIPKRYVDKFHPAMPRKEAEAVGVSIVVDIAATIRSYIDGYYLITPFKRYSMMEQIVKNML